MLSKSCGVLRHKVLTTVHNQETGLNRILVESLTINDFAFLNNSLLHVPAR